MPLFFYENGLFEETKAFCAFKMEYFVLFQATFSKIMAQMSLFHHKRHENE